MPAKVRPNLRGIRTDSRVRLDMEDVIKPRVVRIVAESGRY